MPSLWQWLGAETTAPTLTTAASSALSSAHWTWSGTNQTPSATTSGGIWIQGANGQIYYHNPLAYQQQHLISQTTSGLSAFSINFPVGAGGALFRPSAPAIVTRQEEERRLRADYERAMQEHDQQETDRLLRQLERHALLDAEERRAAEMRRQQAAEAQQQQAAAKMRAQELLFEHLSPEQRDTFNRNGWFVVEGGRTKTKYRIGNRGVAGNIDVLTAANRVSHRLCAHAQSHIPHADQWLAQKVMLELAEDDFLRIANRHAA